MVSLKAGSPADVAEGKQRKIAWVIYILLILGFLGVTAWQIVVAAQARADPPTRARIEGKMPYAQPRFTVCPFGGFIPLVGEDTISCTWDYYGNNQKFINQFNETHRDYARPNCTWKVEEWEDPEESASSSSSDSESDSGAVTPPEEQCITFNLNYGYKMQSKDFGLSFGFLFNYTLPPDEVVALQWSMYMTDDVSEESSETLLRFGSNNVKVYATRKTYIDSKQPVWEYDTQTVYTDTVGLKGASGYAEALYVSISIPNLQVTIIEELDPLNIATILGSIGGFWNYVGMIFGIIFAVKLPSSATAIWGEKKDDKKDDKKDGKETDKKEEKKQESGTEMSSAAHSPSAGPSSPERAPAPARDDGASAGPLVSVSVS